MDSDTGGWPSNDLKRQAAAQIARRKVLAAYTVQAEKKAAEVTNQSGHLKDAPISSKINSESWRRYHTAWQDYYQKYYSEYYANAARNYVANERLKDAKKQAEDEKLIDALSHSVVRNGQRTGLKLGHGESAEQSESNDVRTQLRKAIRKKATDKAQGSRRFRKFIPLIVGLSVTLIILFLQYNRLIFAPIMAYVSPGNAPATQIEALDPTITQTISADPRLIIPKLNIDVPIRFGVPLSGVMSAMNNGVAHYRIAGASAYPGEVGNFVITGHSAGDVYSSNPYKYIFSGLERLENDDLIYVNYESTRYTYRVVKKDVIEPSNVAALTVNTDKPIITLVTCTPLGTSRYRLLVTGEQISPEYGVQQQIEEDIDINEKKTELPANEPSFFEGLWNWLTGA